MQFKRKKKWYYPIVNRFRAPMNKIIYLEGYDKYELSDLHGLYEFDGMRYYITRFIISGDHKEVQSLYDLTRRFSKNANAYYADWIGYIVKSLCGYTPREMRTFGRISSQKIDEEGRFDFTIESFNNDLVETIDFIASKFKNLQVEHQRIDCYLNY